MSWKIGRSQRLGSRLDDNLNASSSMKKNGLSVHESIQRGRAALVEAEDHIQKFEEYLQSTATGQGIEDGEDSMVLDVGPDDDYWINAEEKMNSSCCLDEILDTIDPIISALSNTETLSGTTDCVGQSMRDGEAKMEREEINSSVRINGDFALNEFSKNRLLHGTEPAAIAKPRSRRLFDPKNSSAARRAVVKELCVASDCKKELKQFKARPLPGGREVNNDPYALTQAARGKLNQRTVVDGDDALDDTFASSRLDASAILGNDASITTPPGNAHSNNVLQNKHKKSRISKEIYSVTTKFVAKDFVDECSSEESSSDLQGVLGLHQEIARLQAELKIRRKQCIETIHSLEDETQCSSINDIGIPALLNQLGNKAGSDERDLMQNSARDCETSFQLEDIVNTCDPLPADAKTTDNNDANENAHKRSLYMRQKAWLDKAERKKREAKEREEYDRVKDVTGKPNLNRAKASWSKAKEEHDGLVKVAREREAMIKREKTAKEKQHHVEQRKEAEDMQTLAKEHAKSAKKGIDRQMQAEYVDKLSQPTYRLKVEHPPTKKPNNADVDSQQNDQEQVVKEIRKIGREEEGAKYGTEPEHKITVSFADMDDHEFAKMIKTIQARAKKETRKPFDGSDNRAMRDVKSKEKSVYRHPSTRKKADNHFSPYQSKT